MCIDVRTEQYIDDPKARLNRDVRLPSIDDVFVDIDKRTWVLSGSQLIEINGDHVINLLGYKGKIQDLSSDRQHVYIFYDTGNMLCYDLKNNKVDYQTAAYPKSEYYSFNRTSLVVKGQNGFYQLRNGEKAVLQYFDLDTRSWQELLRTTYTLNTVVTDNDDIIYVTCATGMWKVDRRNNQQTYIPSLKTVDGETIHTEISTVFIDKQEGLWLGTLNRGLLYHHSNRYKMRRIGKAYFPDVGLRDIEIQDFAEDANGEIYVKTQNSIYRKNSVQQTDNLLSKFSDKLLPVDVLGRFSRHQNKQNESNDIICELVDSRGWHWTGTADGLILIKPEINTKQIFYTKDGLSNNFIHAILEDRNKNIWITTSSGISRLQINTPNEKVHISTFNSIYGALESEYVDNAAFESSNGTLYFGGINGFNVLNPDIDKKSKLPFKPIFTSLYLKGEKIEIGKEYNGRTLLSTAPTFTDHLALLYHQNFLTFEFSALNYQNPSQTYYRYQMIGIDQDWRETSHDRRDESKKSNGKLSVSYTNLPPGNYLLRVVSSMDNQLWGAPTDISITISPPWWKTRLATWCYVTLALSVGYASIAAYTRASHRKLEQKHREEILLLRIKSLIEQCRILEAEKKVQQTANEKTEPPEEYHHGPADADFLARAIAQVEKNINQVDYSVEQLSKDLCMDRTGLYRKLVNLLDKSPSLFIRHIRLQHAATLLSEGKYSIAGITNLVGFSSASYFSKCFQERYGCKPSEYALNSKKST